MSAIDIQNLRKVYKHRQKLALDDISLTIPQGSIFGLLGPNGAGKSTLINILAGLVVKTAGQVAIAGFDIEKNFRQARSAIGIVPQELNLDPFFTPLETLEVQAGLYGVPAKKRRTMEILTALGLADKAHAHARALSGGMRRRLLIAKALVHSPKILVLDEPTAGVDIELRQQLWAYVRELNAQGTTILLTTHYLEEAEKMCEEIAIINHGKLIAQDKTPNLLRVLDSKSLIVELAEEIREIPSSLAVFNPVVRRGYLVFNYKPSLTPAGAILNALSQTGLQVKDLKTQEPGLEELFLELTR